MVYGQHVQCIYVGGVRNLMEIQPVIGHCLALESQAIHGNSLTKTYFAVLQALNNKQAWYMYNNNVL